MSDVPARRADAAERAERAYVARLNGATWRQVAEVAGYSDQANARRAVERWLGDIPAPAREAQREILREQTQIVVRQALQDVHDRRPGAVTAAVRVLDLQARLDGLLAPTNIALIDPTQEEIDAYLERLLGAPRFVDSFSLED